eukprot:XP_001703756.1 predicted protein [Chlamydomonas reinhardtii]
MSALNLRSSRLQAPRGAVQRGAAIVPKAVHNDSPSALVAGLASVVLLSSATPAFAEELPAVAVSQEVVIELSAAAGKLQCSEAAVQLVTAPAIQEVVSDIASVPQLLQGAGEPVDWREMYKVLVARGGVKTVTPQEAAKRAKSGAVLLDVRLADKAAARAALPSLNLPLYRPITGSGLAANIRRVGFAFFGIFGTELNPNFVAEVAAKIPKNKEVIVLCESGGTLENKPGTQFGFQSRSLKAVYYLTMAGYTNVAHMKACVRAEVVGFREWHCAVKGCRTSFTCDPTNQRRWSQGPSPNPSGGLESDAPPLRHEALVQQQKSLRGDATLRPPHAPSHTVPVLTTSSIDRLCTDSNRP